MKNRKILLLLAVLLLLSGCKKQPTETEPTETGATAAATEATVPQVEYASAEVNGIPVILDILSRGDTVELSGSFDEKHYVVKLDTGYGLVEKNLLRLDGKTPYASWTGYAYPGAKLYDNYRLAGQPAQALEADARVTVLEDLLWCYLVEYNGNTGYMKRETIAQTPVADHKTPSGGENQEGAVGQDGGEISLQLGGKLTLLSTLAPQGGTVSGKATILADETPVVLGYFDRGDKIPLLNQGEKDGYLTVYLDGLYARVATSYVRTAEEKTYEVWNGKTDGIVSVYDDFWMLGSPSGRLNGNVTVRILYELENCYLVEADGMTGYMAKVDVVEALEGTVPTEPKPTEPKPTEPKPTEPKPTEPKPTEPKPTEPKPTEPKPTEPKPTEPKPTEPEPTESKPTEPKPTEPKPTEPIESTEPTEPTAAPEWTPPIL